MKVRNLLLAGLALAAMTACSNNDEFIDNGNNQSPTGEQASLRISFSSAAIEGARASGTVEDEAEKDDNEAESTVTTATIVLKYSTFSKVYKDLPLTGSATDKDVASTSEFTVTADKDVTVYAFINPSNELNSKIESASNLSTVEIGVQALPVKGLDYLASTIANTEAKSFLMSGNTPNQTIEAGVTNKIDIEVNRVCAKLEETTTGKKRLDNPTVSTTDQTAVEIEFVGHSYSNLVKNSYLLPQANSWTSADSYLQPKGSEYRWITSDVTYCLENKVGGAWESAKATATNVQYQGQVYFKIGEQDSEKAATFYVKTSYENDKEVRTIYKSWAAMKEVFTSIGDENQDEAALKAMGIVKYEDGICYYEAPIQHTTGDCKIVRNNWYELEVIDVADLGWSTPLPPTPNEPTKLVVNAKIKNWTIHKNNIHL